MLNDDKSYDPFVLYEVETCPGTYCLELDEDAMEVHAEVFENNDRESNGYGWADVAIQAIRTEAFELETSLDFDPNKKCFVACGKDLQALKDLGSLLRSAYHHRNRLNALVASAPFEYQ